MSNLQAWLQYASDKRATDVILTVGVPPQIRTAYGYEPIPGTAPLKSEDTKTAAYSIIPRDAMSRFLAEGDYDGSYATTTTRFRVNVFLQRGCFAIAMRRINDQIPDMAKLGLPRVAQKLIEQIKGLLLITGPTGSGKSTTLAAMVARIANTRSSHIITVEDPIEYNFNHSKSVVEQREVGRDTQSFHRALRAALRQRPDCLVVGEMRDTESIGVAITMAETGHLVLGTLHTNDSAQTIDRIVDVFPATQQRQIRIQLASSLIGVISQVLLPRSDGKGLIAAFEVLLGTPAIKAMIRDGKTHQIRSVLQTSASDGHVLLESSLANLVSQNLISQDIAESATMNPEDLRAFLGMQGAFSLSNGRRKPPWR